MQGNLTRQVFISLNSSWDVKVSIHHVCSRLKVHMYVIGYILESKFSRNVIICRGGGGYHCLRRHIIYMLVKNKWRYTLRWRMYTAISLSRRRGRECRKACKNFFVICLSAAHRGQSSLHIYCNWGHTVSKFQTHKSDKRVLFSRKTHRTDLCLHTRPSSL